MHARSTLATCLLLCACSGAPDEQTDAVVDLVLDADADTDADADADTDTDADTDVATGDTAAPTTDGKTIYDVGDFVVDIEAYTIEKGPGTGTPDTCSGSVELTLAGTDLTGTGLCTSQQFKAIWTFDFTGSVTKNELEGIAVVTHFSGATEDVPFSGNLDATSLSASFDHTWSFSGTTHIDLASDFDGVPQ